MAKVIRVANPGVDALASDNPKDFSLFTDGTTDHILIKEKSRGVQSVASFSNWSINHNLGYFPMFMGFAQIGSEFQWIYGNSLYDPWSMYSTINTLTIENVDTVSRTFGQFIFYDNL